MSRALTLYLVELIFYLRGKKLSDGEQIIILALNEAGMSASKIARKIGRSKCAVNSFHSSHKYYGSKKSRRRPEFLTERQSRQIWEQLRGPKMSSFQI